MTIHRDKHPNLVFIIASDLFFNAKLPLVLLFFILISGVSVVVITYKTRELIVFHEKVILEKEVLEIENRHLMLEEKVLFNLSHIERLAIKKFNMKYVNFNEENIIYCY